MLKTLALLRRGLMAAFLVQLVAGVWLDFRMLWGWLLLGGAMLAGIAAEVVNRPAPPAGGEAATAVPPATEVGVPVTGRWSALNSPADRVPSHGTSAYGQSHAIDITAAPGDRPSPAFGWWPIVRGNRAFPAFDQPLFAVADATVVHAADRHRDHLSRNSYPALAYLFIEGLVRDTAGPGRVVGNHLILDLGGGVHAMYAHLRRGSLTVRPGDRVTAGQLVARCGNSGNSTEPHLHFQLMDGPDLVTARGLPFTWRGAGVPANGEEFSANGEELSATS
ncbi:M23 family peptidase [Streptomyces sp. 8K308]|uniref:M23 family metallopeptidase n=1 Tax=Streptomyces sp. 8K308 TaxID=2530388 RepID=UPI0010529A8D|nr:M23 family metallopeptidase [Streptomyces sp. 8K308]TDC20291.1 M23 family peptidase [Streptomyces sp. 8K308]